MTLVLALVLAVVSVVVLPFGVEVVVDEEVVEVVEVVVVVEVEESIPA